MAFQDQSEFHDKDVALVYIASNTGDSAKAEAILTNDQIDYTLMEPPFSTALGLTERPGIGFYVISGQAQYCRNLLLSNKLSGIWHDD